MPSKKSRRERVKASAKRFNLELKKSLNTAIVAAFGFLIALSWRDVITEYIGKITTLSPVQGKLISAIIITFIGVFGILIVAKFLKVGE